MYGLQVWLAWLRLLWGLQILVVFGFQICFDFFMLLKELVTWEELDGATYLLTQFVESF